MLSSYRSRVQSLIGSVVSNSQDMEELTQDTFLKVFDGIRHFNAERGTLANWIYRIAYNIAINFANRQPPPAVPLDEAPPDTLNISDAQIDQELSKETDQQIEALNQAVGSLPPDERLIITLYYYEGYDTKEIAQLTEVSEGTVRSRLSRGRASLRAMLQEKEAAK